MRLLTANLYTGRAIVSSFADVLDREQPDVVVCQELGTDVARLLQARFDHGVVVGDDRHYEGRAMVSNSPIEVEEIDMAYRPGLRTRLEIGGVGVELVGIHLANPVLGPSAVRDRKLQVDSVLHHVDANGTPAVVVGDMNATPVWRSYRRLRRRLRDGIADARRRDGLPVQRTWAPVSGWPAMLRIDHILTAGVLLEDVAVRPVAGSDHRAVAATIRGLE